MPSCMRVVMPPLPPLPDPLHHGFALNQRFDLIGPFQKFYNRGSSLYPLLHLSQPLAL